MTNNRRKWFSRDADALRADLLRYAGSNFGDQIVDFSPASPGGMLMEMAAQVGDSFQFYLDYAFGESKVDTANEVTSIERFLREVGIIPVGASPSSGEVTLTIDVPADPAFSGARPLASTLPTIKVGTVLEAANGTRFNLVENVDFSRRDANDNFLFEIVNTSVNAQGEITSYRIRKRAVVVSGSQSVQRFSVGSPVPFRTLTLDRSNVHEIVNVTDASGRRWHEVENLAQDIAYTRRRNLGGDRREVPTLLRTISTSRRFVRDYSLRTGRTSLRFGAGTDPRVVDTEDFSVPFRNARVVPLQLDAGTLGRVRSFGEAPANTEIVVTYLHGGGLSHNVPEGSIATLSELEIEFPDTVNSRSVDAVVDSLSVDNPEPTAGGAQALSVEEWRSIIPVARAAQNRVVSPNDLIARTLSMPGEFGRVFKAATRASYPGQPSRLWVVCRDNSRLVPATPSLKDNLRIYLTEQRLIGDAIDILDCPILNWALKVRVVASSGFPKQRVYRDVGATLREAIVNLSPDPDQPLDIDRIRSSILRARGVDEITSLEILPRSGVVEGRDYSDYSWSTTKREGKISPPPGGVFEMLSLSNDLFIFVE